MISFLENMPVGTIGPEVGGEGDRGGLPRRLVPAVRGALDHGDVRLLYILGEDFESHSPGAVWADTNLWAGHLTGCKRVAIVSDAGWLQPSAKAFGWMMAGEVKLFETDDVAGKGLAWRPRRR